LYRYNPASLAYFFRILDINKTGVLTNMEIWVFLKVGRGLTPEVESA
jgi:hypothetical protein